MDHFMSENDTIQNLETFNIANLFWRDEQWEQRFDSVGNYFGDKFVNDIA